MTRAARRATTILLAALTAVTLGLALFAGPALATEGEEATTDEAVEELTGFGTNQWDGLILAAVAGVFMGALAFAMSDPGEIHRAEH
jgi:hypothetical protein